MIRWGTPVVVFEDYDFKAPPPWRRMTTEPEAALVPAARFDSVVAGHLPTIRARRPPPDSGSAPND